MRVAACGFCHHDLLVMKGVLRRGIKPGFILEHEVAGTVVQTGEGVTAVRAGDRVVSILTNACDRCDRCRRGEGIGHGRDGGFAEYLAVSEHALVPVPESVDLAAAALFACPMGVVLQAVQEAAQLRPGETVVVTGTGGGLGAHAAQIGAAIGGRVLAVTSSPEKAAQLAQLGASEVLETEPLDFSEMVLALTEDQGADVIIDTVGSPLFPSTWSSLAQYGRLVLLGEVAGGPVGLTLAEVIFRDARILGSSGVSRALVQEVAGMVARGGLRPVVRQSFPVERAADAFELLASRKVLGRLVLLPG